MDPLALTALLAASFVLGLLIGYAIGRQNR
jgi:hypothetical protein